MDNLFEIHHVNANSLKSRVKQHHMQSYLSKHRPHVKLISETKLNQNYQPNFVNYTFFRNDRCINDGGGTAILVREDLQAEILPTPSDVKIEATIIKVKMNDNEHFVFIAAYIPSQTLKSDDLDKLLSIYGTNNVILAADLNAKHTSWNNNRNNPNGNTLRNWADNNINSFQVLFPNEPTCLRANTIPSILDCFIVSTNVLGPNSTTIETRDFLSDHRAIRLELNLQDEIQTIEPQSVWDWSNCNWNGFNSQIERELEILAIPDNHNIGRHQIDDFVNSIELIFENALGTHCPRVKINRSKLIKLSNRSLALIKNKNRIRSKLYANRNSANYFVIERSTKSELKLLNNMIINSIAEDYRSHFMAKIKSIDTRNQNVFREIQKISSYKRRDNLPSLMTNELETENYRTNVEKANGFAQQFASVNNIATEEDENEIEFEYEVEQQIDNWYEQLENDTIIEFSDRIRASDPHQSLEYNVEDPSIKFLNSENLKKIIKTRKNKKSSGADGITTKMLKVLNLNSLVFLATLLNHIINTGYYPSKWKLGIVIPVPKKGKARNKVSSYRPIQLLSNLSKLLEKHISDTILDYNEKFKLFPKQQFAYQRGKSTWHPLVSLSHTITNNLNDTIEKPTIIVTLDFEKAFDLLWVKGLIWKCLNRYNFSNATAKILYNFMRNRSFQTSIQGSKSDLKALNRGSPQGSSISALAFLLYTSDFPEPSAQNMKTLRYADDIAIVVSDPNVYNAQNVLNTYLNEVVHYTKKYRLKLNKTKCEMLIVLGRWADIGATMRKKLKSLEIKIDESILECKEEIKYLGLIFNKQFHFRKHVDAQINRARVAFQMCKNLFRNKSLDVKVKSLLYKSLIRSILSYGFAAWNNINSYNMEKIRKFERKILRACTNMYRQENSVKFINSSKVYRAANCDRFDIFVNKNQVKFFDRIVENQDEFLTELAQCNDFEEQKTCIYKTPSYMYEISKRNLLIEDSKFLYYNKSRNGEIAYVTAQ